MPPQQLLPALFYSAPAVPLRRRRRNSSDVSTSLLRLSRRLSPGCNAVCRLPVNELLIDPPSVAIVLPSARHRHHADVGGVLTRSRSQAMPPPTSDEPDDAPSTPKSKSPAAVAAARAATAPRATTSTGKKTANGAPATPKQKTAAGRAGATPATAPARTRSGVKKTESTLLGDFLLGRPSPSRRRKSLDIVKAEMRAAAINKVPAPGGVKDRVRQWQKANAQAIKKAEQSTEDAKPADPSSEHVVETVIEEETTDEVVVDAKDTTGEDAKENLNPHDEIIVIEEDGTEIADQLEVPKPATNRPAPRKSPGARGKTAPKEVATPKKRVVSDDHWMKKKNSVGKRKASPKISGGKTLPKDFLQRTAINPPVEHKIDDWVKRTMTGESTLEPRPSKRRPKANAVFDAAADSSSSSKDKDEVQLKVFPAVAIASTDDKLKTASPNPSESGSSRRQLKQQNMRDQLTPRRSARRTRKSVGDEASMSGDDATPTKAARRHGSGSRKVSHASSRSQGDRPPSTLAFSTTDMPLGAEAGNLHLSKQTQRTISLKVPKVLKKVYEASKDEPPRGGPNLPPSIESWLSATTDPFVDRPDIPESVVSAARPAKTDTADTNPSSNSAQEARESLSNDKIRRATSPALSQKSGAISDENEKSNRRGKESSESSPRSPSSLKRRTATRTTSSPLKPVRKGSLKDVLVEAFRGESDAALPKVKPSISVEKYDDSLDNRVKTPKSPRCDEREDQDRSGSRHHSHSRRPPLTGSRPLSTIASMETISSDTNTIRSAADSKTTATTITNSTDLKPSISRGNKNKHGLRRRYAKHSDLISVLSLPDTTEPQRSSSIRSARSVRTTRRSLDTATISDLMQELADDEAKYSQELKALVDGVIPVLLKCVLSKSEAAIAAGLFDPTSESDDREATKPIVDMGVALERLKKRHRRIPLQDPTQLLTWAEDCRKIYEDYMTAWRMGFHDVVVNLAPASRESSLEALDLDDAQADDGARMDVAFLLKRPLIRAKYLSKVIKGIDSLSPTHQSETVASQFQALVELARVRTKQEKARLVDQGANNLDKTRARDIRTLAPKDSVKIDRTRQVCAKDFFALDFSHSSGQQIGCRVELILRDKPGEKTDPGDLLICELNTASSWLLFPPVELDWISIRKGDDPNQLVVATRGFHHSEEWRECFTLTSDDHETAQEWVELLSQFCSTLSKDTEPLLPSTPQHSFKEPKLKHESPSTPKARDIEIPLGAKLRREAESSHGPNAPEKATRPRAETVRVAGSRNHVRTNSDPVATQADGYINLPYLPKFREKEPEAKPKTKPPAIIIPEPQPTEPSTQDVPPIPPPHRTPPSPTGLKKGPVLEPPTLRNKTRRTSSPLKHEYQPSDASETSVSEASDSGSDGSDSYYSSSSEDETEEEIAPPRRPKHHPAASSVFSLTDNTVSPSNSASQAPYRTVPTPAADDIKTLIASISCWSDKHGRWDELHPEECSICISPGLIEAYVVNSHSNSREATESSENPNTNERPLLGLELTPLVPLRQSNAIDIEIRSPPTSRSLLKSSGVVRFRSRSLQDCKALYFAIHRARLDNPTYKRLEQERILSGYGKQSEGPVNRRRSWFGRRNSYRASTRAPSELASTNYTENSASSFASAFSALRRLSGGAFNIAKSSIDTNYGLREPSSGSNSLYSSSDSASGWTTPPKTASLATSRTSGVGEPLGSENLKVRLYAWESSSKWADFGAVRLTVTQPAPGQKQASSLYHGIERRIIMTSKAAANVDGIPRDPRTGLGVLLDVVLGGGCFSRIGVVGIAINIWEDMVGPDGEVGRPSAYGAVGSKTRKWMIQCQSAAQARWIFALVGGGIN